MPAPTLVAEYESTFTSVASGTARLTSVTVASGDYLVILGCTPEAANITLGTPTGGGLTYTLRQSNTTGSNCATYAWTAPSASVQTFNVSITSGSGGFGYWGYTVLRYSGSDGIGASSKTVGATGAPSLAVTTTGANSAVAGLTGDWNAVDGASRTWRTINSVTPTSGNGGERVYQRDSSAMTCYVASWSDVGAAGSKTTGLSAPSGQKYSMIAVEVLGSSAAAAASGPLRAWRRDPIGSLLQM